MGVEDYLKLIMIYYAIMCLWMYINLQDASIHLNPFAYYMQDKTDIVYLHVVYNAIQC